MNEECKVRRGTKGNTESTFFRGKSEIEREREKEREREREKKENKREGKKEREK